jgi:hypothetical protein
MRAGVVQVLPFDDVAYTGAEILSVPTATNNPAELTAMLNIRAVVVDPFIKAGVVQVLPFEDVAYKGAPDPS